MKRWLTILILLAPCSGCMMLDDMLYGEPPPGWVQEQAPPNSCGMPTNSAPASQTAEPELMGK